MLMLKASLLPYKYKLIKCTTNGLILDLTITVKICYNTSPASVGKKRAREKDMTNVVNKNNLAFGKARHKNEK